MKTFIISKVIKSTLTWGLFVQLTGCTIAAESNLTPLLCELRNDGSDPCPYGRCLEGYCIESCTEEVCNGYDDDCDGMVDEGFDGDGDGFFRCAINGRPLDCDDRNAQRFPAITGRPQPELCDGIDNDCSDATLDTCTAVGTTCQTTGCPVGQTHCCRS